MPLLGNASEATETDKSGEFENRRYLPAFVELMKASGQNVPGIFYRSDRTAGTNTPRFVNEEKGASGSYRNG